MKHYYFAMMLFLAVTLMACEQAAVEIVSTKVEMQENPVGLETAAPRFSWQLVSTHKNVQQETYRIQVARSEQDLKKEENLVWDTGNPPVNPC